MEKAQTHEKNLKKGVDKTKRARYTNLTFCGKHCRTHRKYDP